MPATKSPTVPLECFAAVAPGLEALALAEARAVGLPAQLAPGGGGISWTGDLRLLILANATLRIASRVVVRLAEFEARSFAELERHARRVPWARVVGANARVRFRVTCKKSKLYHSDAVAQRMADALVRALPGVRAEGSSVGEDEPDEGDDAQLIVVRVLRDHCTVSADSSGALLHRRGYRQATAKAPLRETLAAALLAASEWDGRSPLVDPLCGSGTILIEGALIADRIAPNQSRQFAMERWPDVLSSLLDEVRSELVGGQLRAGGYIGGSDRDAGAIASAAANAERAGVADRVEFAVQALSAAAFPGSTTGWVVTNPPYGVRVGDAHGVRDLWAQLGHVLRARAPGWRLAVLSPDVALERELRIPLQCVTRTTNGGIPIRIVTGEVPS